VDEVVKTATGIEAPATEDFFNHMYETLWPELERQRDTLRTNSLGQDPSQAGLKAEAQRV